jgi:hypothetical protein
MKTQMKKIIFFLLILPLLLSFDYSTSFSRSYEFFGEENGVRLEAEIRYNRIFLWIENIAATLFTINSFFDSFYAKSRSGKTYRLRVIFPEYYSCVLIPAERGLIILEKPEQLKKEDIQSILLYLGSQGKEIWLLP